MDFRPRLLLVEDDAQLGPLLRDVLAEVYAVTLETDVEPALARATDESFDVLVLDRMLPGGDGLEILAALRENGDQTPVLMLTALGTVRDRVTGLDSGANDYLIKPFDFEELFARLRAIRRSAAGEGPLLRLGAWEFYPESRAVYSPYDGRTILTEREAALLSLFARNPQRTFSRKQILREVFGRTDDLGTVDTYVHYVRRKIDPAVVTTVRGLGYRLGQL
ncbi:response regulator transcription factor [Gryllotalpicola sp.]|uniref:response regulator transcription factor n=1 Tax=Gryllotalpicola sp. TaxID=1932787 RepID=UPI0026222FC6|nr:response regulator transcription factor [Gryllotalpicola sp.]